MDKEKIVPRVEGEETKETQQLVKDIDTANAQIDPHFYATLIKQMKEEENERGN